MKIVDGKVVRGPRIKGQAQVYELHNDYGVRQVINLQEGWSKLLGRYNEENECKAFGIRYIAFALSNIFPPSVGAVSAIMSAILNGEKKTYVHCYKGVDRTGYVVALYNVLRYDRSPEEEWDRALKEGMHKRFFWWRKSFIKTCEELRPQFRGLVWER